MTKRWTLMLAKPAAKRATTNKDVDGWAALMFGRAAWEAKKRDWNAAHLVEPQLKMYPEVKDD